MPWGYINRYNPRQSQPALGGLTPSGYSNQAKDKRGKLKVRGRRRGEPADPEGARVKPGNAAPEPPILERKAREVQDPAITTSHPQLNQKYSDNHPYSYKRGFLEDCTREEILPRNEEITADEVYRIGSWGRDLQPPYPVHPVGEFSPGAWGRKAMIHSYSHCELERVLSSGIFCLRRVDGYGEGVFCG